MNLRKDHYSKTWQTKNVPKSKKQSPVGSQATGVPGGVDDRSSSTRSVCVSLTFPRTREERNSTEAFWGYPSKGLKASLNCSATAPPGAGFSSFPLVRRTFPLMNHSKPRGDGVFHQLQANPSYLCCQRRDWTIKEKKNTLGGGSLGSCVDEGRSQLRELM